MIIDSERSIIGTKDKYIYLSPICNIIMTNLIEKTRVNIKDLQYILAPYNLKKTDIQQHIYYLNKIQKIFKIKRVMSGVYELKIDKNY